MTNKVMQIIYKPICLLYKKIKMRKFRVLVEKMIMYFEGGIYWSGTLRKLYVDVHNISIGIGSYGCFVPKNFPSGTIIGNYSSIAPNVVYLNANHPYEFASMHPLFYSANFYRNEIDEEKISRNSLKIGHDVWIGRNVIILSSCTEIGNGAVIGAGSVVTKNVAPYTIVAGNPAKKIKDRFNLIEQNALENSQWYNLPPGTLNKFASSADSINSFIRNIEFMK